MTRPDAPSIPLAADERTTLNAFLDYYRAELLDRAWGLTHEQLNQTHPPSTLTMSRLIGHLTGVELHWFSDVFAGVPEPQYLQTLDWDADPDAEMTRSAGLPVEQLLTEFTDAVDDSRRRVAAAASLDQLATQPTRDGEYFNLRWILVHMIEEYARHCGHADLIREAVDGDIAR